MSAARAVNIADLQRLARRRLPRIVYDYIEGGAEDELCLARNEGSFARYRLVPRFLTQCDALDHSVALFGRRYDAPFGIAPTGLAGLFRPGGDAMLAEAAAAANIPYLMSGWASTAMEELPPEARKNTWYQLYSARDRAVDADLIRRAADAGIGTLVLTIDAEARAKRERDIRSRFLAPRIKGSAMLEAVLLHPAWVAGYLRTGGRPTFRNYQRYAGEKASPAEVMAYMSGLLPGIPTWADLERIRRLWPGTLVVKGLLHPEDAVRAVELGADGIIVSNHGGRQLDRAPAPLEIFPLVHEAVGQRTVLMLDGGIRRGSDIATALCLGARFVFVGRATLYGMVAGGRPGVTRAIEILRHELDCVVKQLGCQKVSALDRSYLHLPG